MMIAAARNALDQDPRPDPQESLSNMKTPVRLAEDQGRPAGPRPPKETIAEDQDLHGVIEVILSDTKISMRVAVDRDRQ